MRAYTMRKAMGAGLLGTLVQTILVYGVSLLGLGRSMDLAALLGYACPLGLLMQVLSGSVCFPLGYVCLASPGFPGPPVLKGMLWAGLLWGVAECLIAPLLGAGVSSAALGGLPAALRALLGYLAYGAVLGGLVGAAGPSGPGAGERHMRGCGAGVDMATYGDSSSTPQRRGSVLKTVQPGQIAGRVPPGEVTGCGQRAKLAADSAKRSMHPHASDRQPEAGRARPRVHDAASAESRLSCRTSQASRA